MPAPLTIGRLAKRAGVNVETVRYYQRIGLLDEPPRPPGGFRHYPPEAVARLRFIRRAQQLGFRLQEIRELLDLADGPCTDVQARARQTRERIQRQITDLQSLRDTLDTLLAACEREGNTRHCPIVESLQDADGKPTP